MNKVFLLLLVLLSACCKVPKEPSKRAYNRWVYEMQEKECLQLIEIEPGKITFLSSRRVGIGEARRMIVRMVRSLRQTGNEPGMVRIMFQESDKMRKFHYITGFIAEAVYMNGEICYGMIGNNLQCVHREDFDVAEGRAYGYPAPPFKPEGEEIE